MKTAEATQAIVGKRCDCIFTGMMVRGTIILVQDLKDAVFVRVRFDEPQNWGGDYYKEDSNWARKSDEFGSLHHLKLI